MKTPSENYILFALVMALRNIKSDSQTCWHQMVIDFSATNLLISWPKKQVFIAKTKFLREQFKSGPCRLSFPFLLPLYISHHVIRKTQFLPVKL